MENRFIFREVLSEIKTAADQAGGVITKEEVRKRLSHLPLEESHLQMVFSYLTDQGIRVPDDDAEAAELPEEQPDRSLALYLEELEQLAASSGEDETKLLARILEGDAEARDRLIERYLPLICEMAGEYEGDEVAAEDLIQEGNLGLLTALAELSQFENPAACHAHLLNGINQAMQDAIEEGQEQKKRNNGIADRVNHLNEAVGNLERDLERKVSIEELSAYLDMPLEEIRDVLRMSGDQIELAGDRKGFGAGEGDPSGDWRKD